MAHVNCIAGGDIFITRELPRAGYPGQERFTQTVNGAELRFANLEILFHRTDEGCPAFSTGTHAICTPDAIEDVKKLGFNLFSTANNHAMDYSHSGLETHLGYLRDSHIAHCGAGMNLQEAAAPRYFEANDARVALISICSTFDKTWAAAEQCGRLPGRPGLNPLGHVKKCFVTERQMETLKEISLQTAIDGQHEQSVKEGFAVAPKDGFWFNGQTYYVSDTPHIETVCNRTDLERTLAGIREGKRQADYVMVSLHCHEQEGRNIEDPPEFIREFCHRCIDEGASVIIGHGPHQLRGIELYHGGLILYSLGNLLFENDTVEVLPAEFYTKYGLPTDSSVGMGIDKRNNNGTTGFAVNPRIWSAVLAGWELRDGRVTDVKLYPVSLGYDLPRYRRGLPAIEDGMETLEYIAKLSEPFGTQIMLENGVGTVRGL